MVDCTSLTFFKGKDVSGFLACIQTLDSFCIYLCTFSKQDFQAILLRPREQAENFITNTVESCLGFLLCLIQSVSEAGGGSGPDIGCWREGTWRSWDKKGNYQFRMPDTMTIQRRWEEKCLQVSHLLLHQTVMSRKQRGTDMLIPSDAISIHRMAGEINKCAICAAFPLKTNLLSPALP